uniref:Uncharacterized protein n=1 Tax=Sander lucioperca TaxID=283035 RepID=A0A8D0ACB5_SANLU
NSPTIMLSSMMCRQPNVTPYSMYYAPPPASKTTPEMYMSLRAWPGFGMWLARARYSRTPPQINNDSPVIKTTRTSDKPPLFSMLIRCRLRTQFMSCTAELSSCLSRTPRASRQRAVPAPSRHSLETLVVVERRPTPPSPQPTIRRSLNHHSSTCSSRMLCGLSWRQICRGSECNTQNVPKHLTELSVLLLYPLWPRLKGSTV